MGIGHVGATVNSVYGNFRYNSCQPVTADSAGMSPWTDVRHGRRLRRLRPGKLVPGDPERRRPGDDPVVPPAGGHPHTTRINTTDAVNDWHADLNQNDVVGPTRRRASSARVTADGHDAATFPDLVPDSNTGKITYDVDNDGDGITDSVWLDLGYPGPARLERASLQAPVRLHGHRLERPDPAQHGRQPGRARAAGITPVRGARHDQRRRRRTSLHLGNSVSEIDPTYGLQNGFNHRANTTTINEPHTTMRRRTPPQIGIASTPDQIYANQHQVDNGGIDVRLTQLRNLLAGTRPSRTRRRPDTRPTATTTMSARAAATTALLSCPTVSPTWRSATEQWPADRLPDSIPIPATLTSRGQRRRWRAAGVKPSRSPVSHSKSERPRGPAMCNVVSSEL